MSCAEYHRDSINGRDLIICLGVVHEVLRTGNGLVLELARHIFRWRRFFLLRRGQQIWLGHSAGYLLSAYIEEALLRHGKQYRDCLLLLPLDTGVYCVALGSFGVRVSDSERIVSMAEALELAETHSSLVISGGRLSEQFSTVKTIVVDDLLEDFKLRSLSITILRALWESRRAVLLVCLTIVLTLLLGLRLSAPAAETQIEAAPVQARQASVPVGVDTAVSQLAMLHRLIQEELPYFWDKALQQLSYDSTGVVTLGGELPPARVLSAFISDMESSSQDLVISRDRWNLQARPKTPARQEFELPGFNESYVALLSLRDDHGFSLSMAATSSDSSTKRVSVELAKNLDHAPNLAVLAELLEGHAVKLQSMHLTFEAGAYRSLKLSLQLRGQR